jgi:DNA-binding XRE family transcriptional regulator
VAGRQLEIDNSIRERRQHLGLTREKFAAKLGVTFPTVNHWENNRGTPSLVAMEKIEGMLRSALCCLRTMRRCGNAEGERKRSSASLSLLRSPCVPSRELANSLLSKYFPPGGA